MRQCIITITSSSGHHDQVIFSLVADTVFPSTCPAQRLMSRSGPSSKPLEVFLTPTPPCTQDGATRLPAQLRDGPIVTMAQSLPNPPTRQPDAISAPVTRPIQLQRRPPPSATACHFQYSSKSFQTTEKSIPCARAHCHPRQHTLHTCEGPRSNQRERARGRARRCDRPPTLSRARARHA